VAQENNKELNRVSIIIIIIK